MQTPLPFVSVVIPVYNVFSYLEDCLNSVIHQSYTNLEILCIDDCSTDGSIEIIKNFAILEPKIRLISHQKNLGLGAARNTGIELARGDYIYFLDSDDYIKTDTIEKLIQRALETDADVVVGGALAFPHDASLEMDSYIQELNQYLEIKVEDSAVNETNFRQLHDAIACVAWGKLYLTSFLRDNYLQFVEKKILHEDNGFHVKVLSCEPRIATIKDCLYQYRIRKNSIMQASLKDSQRRQQNLKISIENALDYMVATQKNSRFNELTQEIFRSVLDL